ncbi:hypothetical protein [Actinoplanes sp. NPDC049316]|uniref:hypothetical protein n=1 Tax=Actinoplanes sp. NPDC049316 TaxID=3154727 RepID=UPI003417B72B
MDDTDALKPFPLAEVAALTGFSLRSLRDDCRARRIEHVHYGNTIVLTRAQLAKLYADHTVTTVREDALAGMRERRRRRVEREARAALRE